MGILYWIAGLLVGFICSFLLRGLFSLGTIEVDQTNPEVPYLRLQLTEDHLFKLIKKKYVILEVDPKAAFTREKQGL